MLALLVAGCTNTTSKRYQISFHVEQGMSATTVATAI